MKKDQITLYILGTILIVILSISCQKDDIDSNPALIHTWKLIDLVRDVPINSISYDSTRCVDDVPYGYIEGVEYLLTSRYNKPDSLIEFHWHHEYWTFFNKGSLEIERLDPVPIHPFCTDAEFSWISSTVEPTEFIIEANWEELDDALIVEDDNETMTFEINSIGADSLKIELPGLKLTFEKQP